MFPIVYAARVHHGALKSHARKAQSSCITVRPCADCCRATTLGRRSCSHRVVSRFRSSRVSSHRSVLIIRHSLERYRRKKLHVLHARRRNSPKLGNDWQARSRVANRSKLYRNRARVTDTSTVSSVYLSGCLPIRPSAKFRKMSLCRRRDRPRQVLRDRVTQRAYTSAADVGRIG